MNTKNTLTCAQHTIAVAPKQRPYSNNFVQQRAELVGKEIHCVVLCTSDSVEPGRMYACEYTLQGKMLGCITVN